MSDTPLFSILIANYNNGRYLQEALDSVFRQTYTNWEVVLVDDGSTDNSEQIYRKYEDSASPQYDPRIRIVRNEKNMGCGYTKRRCAELAQGELCGFLDPDDALTPNALEVMVREHQEHPEVVLIGSNYYVTDENLNPQWHTSKWMLTEGKGYLTDVTQLRPLHFASYKENGYQQTEGINPLLKRAVDMDLYAKIEETGDILLIDDVLYLYRQHSNQVSTHGDFKSMYWELVVLTDACQRRGISAENLANEFLEVRMPYYWQNYVQTQPHTPNKSDNNHLKKLLRKISRKWHKLSIVKK